MNSFTKACLILDINEADKWRLLGSDIRSQHDYVYRWACSYGKTDVANYLDTICKDFIKENPHVFKWACENGELETAKRLYEMGIDPMFENGAALIHACKTNQYETVKWLYSIGVNNEYNQSESFLRACRKCDTEMVKLLHSLGADIRCNDDEAILYACRKSNMEIVRLLHSYGVDISCRNDEPFLTACSVNNLSVVKLLIELGHIFKKDNNFAIFSVCNDSIDVVKYFYELDAELKQNINRYFNLACDFGSVDTAKFLLQVGADPSVDNWESFRNACRLKFNIPVDFFESVPGILSKYMDRCSYYECLNENNSISNYHLNYPSYRIIDILLEYGVPNHIINDEFSNAISSKRVNIIYTLHKFASTNPEIDEKIEKLWQDRDYYFIYMLCDIGIKIKNCDDKILHLKQFVNNRENYCLYMWQYAYWLLQDLLRIQNK